MVLCIKLFRKIFSVALLLALSVSLFSQEYIPMNFKDGVWIDNHFANGEYMERTQKFCKEDTLIDNDLYYKLYETKIQIYYTADTIYNIYLGLIGNFPDKTVKYIPSGEVEPIMIYDFNLNIGDTVKGVYDGFVINNIDSVEICGRYHKRYSEFGTGYPDNPSFPALIESIGYSNGLLGYFDPFHQAVEDVKTLECYSEWTNQDCAACDFIEGISVRKSGIHVYPNPFTDRIKVQSSKPVIQIKIYDILGHEIFSENSLLNDDRLLELNHLVNGIYLLRIQFNDHTFYSLPIVKT